MTQLHERLASDCFRLGNFPLSILLLMNDARFPWCILVPSREGITEIHQLNEADRQQLMRESCHLAEVMAEMFSAHKMNVASLGNIIPQLHVHHVARNPGDAAWPGPVWGSFPPVAYSPEKVADIRALLYAALGEGFTPGD
ncbi:MAG: HIT domain-containing protein [Nitrospirota bacterium]|nr:HIT domain-containing protein [Nitrospirota bacterium]